MSDINSMGDITKKTGSDIKISIVLRISPDLLLAVDEAAKRRGTSRNGFMVKALTRVIEGEPHVVTSRPKGFTGAS